MTKEELIKLMRYKFTEDGRLRIRGGRTPVSSGKGTFSGVADGIKGWDRVKNNQALGLSGLRKRGF